MKSKIVILLSSLVILPHAAFAQGGVLAQSSDLPLLGVISAGIIAGGVISALRTRHQK
jgi:hypothetical protein